MIFNLFTPRRRTDPQLSLCHTNCWPHKLVLWGPACAKCIIFCCHTGGEPLLLLQHVVKTTSRVTGQQEAERSHTWCSQGPCGESLQMFSKHPRQISRSVALPISESHSAAQLSLLKCCFPRKPQHLTSCHPRSPRGSLEIRSGSAQPQWRSPPPRARASASASAAGGSRGGLAGQQMLPSLPAPVLKSASGARLIPAARVSPGR